ACATANSSSWPRTAPRTCRSTPPPSPSDPETTQATNAPPARTGPGVLSLPPVGVYCAGRETRRLPFASGSRSGRTMVRINEPSRRGGAGMTRRELLRLGGLSLAGLSLPQLLAAEARARESGRPGRQPKARSCLLVFTEGGPSHIDLWDLKP